MKIKLRVATLATAVALSGAAAVMPLAAIAQSTPTVAELLAQIEALTALVNQLRVQQGAPAPAPAAAKCVFTRSLSQGASGEDVKCLQKYLNSAGHKIVASGAGSPGSETTFYGALTKAAVAKWQAANSLSPAVGFFGPLSRAKYDSMVVVAPVVPPAAPVVPPGAPVPAGTGLTVSGAADQPATGIIAEGAARVPFVKVVFTAGSDGDVTVKSVTLERKGPLDDAAFDGILLVDEDGSQIGNAKTLTSDHKVVLNEEFKVMKGTSKTITVAANMAASLDSYSEQSGRLEVVAVNAGSAVVTGSLPIASANRTMNSTLAIGSVTMSIGALDPGASNTKNVGTKGYYLASVKGAVGSAEDVTFDQIRWNQAGSAGASDLANIVVVAGGKDYVTTASSDGKYYVTKFPGGLKVKKGASLDFSIKADLVNGSSRTVDMNILRKADVVVMGDTFGYYVTVGGGSSGSASEGAFSSNQEPFFNAYDHTIDKGSVAVSSSNKVPSSNVPVDVNDTNLGAFLLDVKGEPARISSFRITFSFSGTGTSTDLINVKLVDEKTGGILAGPKDGVAAGITFTDTFTLPVGENVVLVKGKADTTFVSNDTVQVSVDPDDSLTVKGEVTGLSITPTPSSTVSANSQTVKAGALAMSVSLTPPAQNVVRGVNGFHFGTFNFDAGSSGEDIRVTSVKLTDTVSADGREPDLNSCVLYDGATALNSGSDVVNPTDDSGTDTQEEYTFNLTNNLVVTKGTVKKVDLKCNISPSATAESTHAWGLTVTDAAGVSGAVTSQSITESVTTSNGSIMTVKTAGTFTVQKDASAPSATMVLSGKIEVPLNVLLYRATNEAITITELTLTYSSSTASTSDFLKATVWDGATRIGEAVWAGSAVNATSTFITTAPFVVPKDGTKLLTIKADLASIDVTASSTAGRLLALDYSGVSSSTGTGQSSGARLGSSSSSNTAGAAFQIMRSIPTVEKVAVPSTSIPQGNGVLYRFKVVADAAGPVALYKFSFAVSSSSVSATSSNFNLYGYNDSAFSVRAYDQNPLNARKVTCVGHSPFETDANCATDTARNITASSSGATSSEVVFFFTPTNYVTGTTSEAIVVPAGQTRYFELRGDITNPGSGTGNSISVYLLGDNERPIRRAGTAGVITGDSAANTPHGLGPQRFVDNYGQGLLATAAEIHFQFTERNNFIWSPMSTSTSLTGATSTTDWTNGFLVPGLPQSGMSSNVFTN